MIDVDPLTLSITARIENDTKRTRPFVTDSFMMTVRCRLPLLSEPTEAASADDDHDQDQNQDQNQVKSASKLVRRVSSFSAQKRHQKKSKRVSSKSQTGSN